MDFSKYLLRAWSSEGKLIRNLPMTLPQDYQLPSTTQQTRSHRDSSSTTFSWYITFSNTSAYSLFKKKKKNLNATVTMHAYMLSHFSRVQLFATPWTVDQQALLFMGLSRQQYRSWLPCPPPGDFPDPGIEPGSHVSYIGRQILDH